MKLAGPASGNRMRLDLWNAEAKGALKTHMGETSWRAFTHANKLVNVIELTEPAGSSEAPATVVFEHFPANPARLDYQNSPIPESDRNPEPTYGHNDHNAQWCAQPFKSGGGYVVAWVTKPLSPGRSLILFTVEYAQTGKLDPKKAMEVIDSTLSERLEDITASHQGWWHAYYPKCFL